MQGQALRIRPVGRGCKLMGLVDIGTAGGEIFAAEQLPYFSRTQFLTADICLSLHDLAEFDLQPPRQDELVVALEEIGHSALSRLAVDSNNRVVRAPQIGRVDG